MDRQRRCGIGRARAGKRRQAPGDVDRGGVRLRRARRDGPCLRNGIGESRRPLPDRSGPAWLAKAVASNLGNGAGAIAFDGSRIWTANPSGSVSLVTPGSSIPWTVTTVAARFADRPRAPGTNVWVTDSTAGSVQARSRKRDPSDRHGGRRAGLPVFDGANIWVPNRASGSVTVVRASTGAVLAVDRQWTRVARRGGFRWKRILVGGQTGDTLAWKAADLSPIRFFSPPGSGPLAACSDGVNFWIALHAANQLARF